MTAFAINSMIEAGVQLSASLPVAERQQAEARTRWSQSLWPTRKTESWKYTPLKAITANHLVKAPNPNALTDSELATIAMDDANTILLVFVDGQFDESASTSLNNLPTGLTVTPFNAANTAQQALIAANLDKAAGEHATVFGCLNTAALENGLLIQVAKNAVIKETVRVVNYSQSVTPTYANARILWLQEQSSQATLVEHFLSGQDSALFTNSVTEIFIAANAACEHYRLQLEGETSLHVGGVYSHLQNAARLNSFYLAMGTNLQRVDVVTQFEGEGAEATNNGVYLPVNQQLTDFHTCIEHKVPHCTSNEVFRGIIGDSARAVFNGRIHIHRDAQKTLAELSNKNLLTSAKAEVNTKPELEIYADDVRCAHGATIAELDNLALYYLRTRGMSRAEAQVMLSFGFINELIEQLKNEAVRVYLRPLIAQRFAKEPELLQHLIG